MTKDKFVLISLAFLALSAKAQTADFVFTKMHIDNVRDAKSVLHIAQDCNNSSVCSAALSAASNYYQIPMDKIVAAAALLGGNKNGELTVMGMTLPNGYTYCKSRMLMTSIVPHDGPRGSTFLGRADPTGIYSETWTPVQGIGAGRSWVEADIEMVGVRTAIAEARYQDGTCLRPANRNLFYCRGGGCVSTEDKGQRVPSASPPGANSRN